MITFRDAMVETLGVKLISYTNEEARGQNVNPFEHGSYYTHAMKTVALKAALTAGGYDAAFGGARRDEEKSRAKERVFSFRTEAHEWDPKNQRPEFWHLYNGRVNKGESVRVFPLSNWTELDIWTYIMLEELPVVPLYFSAERPSVMRDGTIIVVDDDRMQFLPGETPVMRKVRFRSLGCWPLSGAVESDALSLEDIVAEMLATRTSERGGRLIDKDASESMEKKKREGYF